MDSEALREEFRKRMEAGESLVTLDKIPALRSLSNTTRSNMVRDGRIPAIRSGRRFLTLVSLVNDSLCRSMVEAVEKNPPPMSRRERDERHQTALAGLIKMGYKPPKDQWPWPLPDKSTKGGK